MASRSRRTARGSMSATRPKARSTCSTARAASSLNQVPLSDRPNNIAVAKDGRIVVGIARGDGALDIIDPVELRIRKSVPVNGRLHNVYVTPDSKFVVTGSLRTGIIR